LISPLFYRSMGFLEHYEITHSSLNRHQSSVIGFQQLITDNRQPMTPNAGD